MYIIRPIELSFVSASGATADAAEWQSPTVYGLGARVARFGREYVSSIAGNQSLPPETEVQEIEGARWILVGSANTVAFLDASPSVSTKGTSPLVLEVKALARFTDITLINLQGSECLVEVFDSGGGLIGSSLINSGAEPVANWWAWLNTVFHKSSRRHVIPLSGGLNATIRITITGDAPSLGELFVGRAVKVGATLFGAQTKAVRRTFTTVDTNDFGNTTIKKRASVRDVTYKVQVKRAGFELVEQVLDAIDGERVVSLATRDDWSQLINVGILETFSLPAELPDDFIIELTVKGVQ